MRYVLLLLSVTMLLGACSIEKGKEDFTFFDENGNLKEEYAEDMEREWCEHNKGQEFSQDRCEKDLN